MHEAFSYTPSLRLSGMLDEIRPIRAKLSDHPVYQSIENVEHLRLFMKSHVFAVWDFMALLTTLQRELTAVQVPWGPRSDGVTRRLINEIVLEEESDDSPDGGYISHYELYKMAMRQAGVEMKVINTFEDCLERGYSVIGALNRAEAPQPAQAFVGHTWKILDTEFVPGIAAAFALGREDVIPTMFREIVGSLRERFPGELELFCDYLDRHVKLDADRHSPMALRMLDRLCREDEKVWIRVTGIVAGALEARVALWDGVLASIQSH